MAVGTRAYVEVFHKDATQAERKTTQARSDARGLVLVESPDDADVVILLLEPQSGDYFNATPGLLELTICEGKPLTSLDGSEYTETTVTGVERFRSICAAARARGAKVVVSVNVSLAWILDDVEPLADAVIAGFATFYDAQLDVLTGAAPATGKLPMPLPASEADIGGTDGVWVLPTRGPGYDKDQHMPDGMTYACVDADANTYRLGHGLGLT